jgi:hypothetical protein
MKRLPYAALLLAAALATSACGGSKGTARSIPTAVIANYSIHVGQTETFGHLRPGDTVGCLGHADSISLEVPPPSVGATTSVTWDKRLLLRLDPASDGRLTAHCSAR